MFEEIGADSENIKKLLSLMRWHVVRLGFDAALNLHVLLFPGCPASAIQEADGWTHGVGESRHRDIWNGSEVE